MQLQQLHRPPPVEQEIFVHHEERLQVQRLLGLFHHLVYVLARFEKTLVECPLPPKNAEVAQKLQPIGQPTLGMIVAHVAPICCGSFSPITLWPNPETISGCRTGASRPRPGSAASSARPRPSR